MAKRARTQNIRNIKNFASEQSFYLRYPYDAILDETDYLLINITEYTPPGGKERRTEVELPDDGGYYDGKGDFIPTITAPELRKKNINSQSVLRAKGQDLYGKFNLQKSRGSIILPVPSNIQDGNSVNFGPSSLDGLTASVLDYASSMIREGQNVDFGNLSNFINQALGRGVNIAASKDVADYFNRIIAAGAANIPFGGNLTASQLLARQTGQVLNPNMELLFEGVNLRSFKFSFKMTPRNAKEARAVRRIIKTFKTNMSPQASGTYLNTPNIFELSYMKGNFTHPFLHKFKQCALTDMSVNYTGEGTWASYESNIVEGGGGTPVSIIMDLGFKELEPIYSGDYNDDTQSDGYDEAIHGGVGF
jgi:hypothetical protein